MQWSSLPVPLSSHPPSQPLSACSRATLPSAWAVPGTDWNASTTNAPDIGVNPLRISHSCSSPYPENGLSSASGNGLQNNFSANARGNCHEARKLHAALCGWGTSVFWPENHTVSYDTWWSTGFQAKEPTLILSSTQFLRVSTHQPLFSAADIFFKSLTWNTAMIALVCT